MIIPLLMIQTLPLWGIGAYWKVTKGNKETSVFPYLLRIYNIIIENGKYILRVYIRLFTKTYLVLLSLSLV